MDLKKTKTDEVLEKEGVWHAIDDESRVLVGRIGNKRYTALASRKTRPYRHQIRQNLLSDEIQSKLTVDLVAETILLGWENLKEGEAVLGPYSVDEAKRLLTTYPDFMEIVLGFANDAEAYRRQDIESASKN